MPTIQELRKKAMALPLTPGVYIMMDRRGEVIYVGKAVKLRNRVSSYFTGRHGGKTGAMVSHVDHFDVIMANTEFEALVLENSLIKRHMPKYNILLKDDKGYPYIRIDMREEYPRFSIAGRRAEDGAEYFGPFGSRGACKSAIETVCRALKLPTCSRRFPRDVGKERPCLNYHMGTCRAYCLRDTPKSDYDDAISEARMIFDGRYKELCETIRKDMEHAAENLDFEYAALLRDKVRAVNIIGEKQKVVSGAKADTDVIGFHRGDVRSCFAVLHYVSGDLADKDVELVDTPADNDGEAVSGFLRQYCMIRGVFPKDILVPAPLDDAEALSRFFTESAGHKVNIICPTRGGKAELVRLAQKNAREEAERATTREERIAKTLEWLQSALGMRDIPKRIEAFDISNTGNDAISAGMSVFVGARPLKRDYRRFMIKSTDTQNDIMSMTEVVTRRYRHLIEGDNALGDAPDLILIDGGAVHARAAENAIRELGINIPVFGMVKDDHHRTHALVSPDGKEIGIFAVPQVFALIGRIQEETHNCAITYQKERRSRFSSELDGIPGVGQKRRNDLMKRFKSIKAIKGATLEELKSTLPQNAALAVYEHFHGGKENEK